MNPKAIICSDYASDLNVLIKVLLVVDVSWNWRHTQEAQVNNIHEEKERLLIIQVLSNFKNAKQEKGKSKNE
jgi:hypothetical protein